MGLVENTLEDVSLVILNFLAMNASMLMDGSVSKNIAQCDFLTRDASTLIEKKKL